MRTIETINLVIMILFYVCYMYQLFYIPIAWFKKDKPHRREQRNHIAVLIAARNEQMVIGNLIESIHNQDYPSELIDVFVCADNCIDNTAKIAGSLGAFVFERNDKAHIGKGYVLNYMLKNIMEGEFPTYDAFLVLDADNILKSNYVTEINKVLSDGYEIVTSYRNSKNYGDNWISAGYGLWFIRESKYLNGPRMKLSTSCAVSGTGFIFSNKVLNRYGGWNFFTLTEDIEFTVCNVVDKERVGYASKAELFDEQPTTFSQSYRQRLRWCRGYYQVAKRYGLKLIKGLLHGSFSCYDMTMQVMPAAILSALCLVLNLGYALFNLVRHLDWIAFGSSLLSTLFSMFAAIFVLGVIATISEWKHIYCSTMKKILYMFTFPFFMTTYLPIAIIALFKNPSWQPIKHDRSVSLEEITNKSGYKEQQSIKISVIESSEGAERIASDSNETEHSNCDSDFDITA